MTIPDKTPSIIQNMFSSIVPEYDFLNHLLSFGMDRSWRRNFVKKLPQDCSIILDVCGGTGDMILALNDNSVRINMDFSYSMLLAAKKKFSSGNMNILSVCADALNTPFRDSSLSMAVSAYGIRNLYDIDKGLEEIKRLLKPGGTLGILEFFKPKQNFIRKIFDIIYLKTFMPFIGYVISGHRDAYKYLSQSIERFYDLKSFCLNLEKYGFEIIWHKDFFFGITSAIVAIKK